MTSSRCDVNLAQVGDDSTDRGALYLERQRLTLAPDQQVSCRAHAQMTIQSATSFLWRRNKAAVAAVALVIAMFAPCRADYPEKPIRLLLPFPAGGAVDFVARLVSARMADELGRPFVIENKAGAGGIIATNATAKAAADGHTLLLTTPNHTINAALNPKLPYDTQKDLVPVSIWAEVPELLVSHPAAPLQVLSTTPGRIQ